MSVEIHVSVKQESSYYLDPEPEELGSPSSGSLENVLKF